MTDKEHRLGVSEVNLVVRHLKMEPVDQTSLQAAIAEVDQIYGLDATSFYEKNHVLNLAYNASKNCLDDIEEVLKSYCVDVGRNWWTHFKEIYYKFVGENVKEKAVHYPWGCHQIPSGVGRKR